jgi:cell division protein FtsB
VFEAQLMKKKLIPSLIIIFSLYLIVSLSREIFDLIQKEKIIGKEQLKLEELKVETQVLKEQLDYVQSEEFVEKEAREKLGMTKPGETVVILPEDFKEMVDQSQGVIEPKEVPNWKQWLGLFRFN